MLRMPLDKSHVFVKSVIQLKIETNSRDLVKREDATIVGANSLIQRTLSAQEANNL